MIKFCNKYLALLVGDNTNKGAKQKLYHGPIIEFGLTITGMKTRRIYYLLRDSFLVSGKDTFNRWDTLFWQIQ